MWSRQAKGKRIPESKTKTNTQSLEHRVFLWVLLTGAVFMVTVSLLLWRADIGWLGTITLLPFLTLVWLFAAFYLRDLLRRHFFSLANVIESLRHGDYTLRVAAKDANSAWSEVYQEINLLAEEFQERRLEVLETDILLNKLLAEFDVPALVFDRNHILQNSNEKGCALFSQPREKLLGLNKEQLHLSQLLDRESGDVVEHWFPERGGRWELRKNFFFQHGHRFMLVLVNDLSRALREEERTAWQRLIRVLGHELNNSLASLTSVSETLVKRLLDEKSETWYQHYEKGLALIAERSNSLLRFTESYTRLAKLPAPEKRQTDILKLVQSIAELLPGNFEIQNTESQVIHADPDQLQQLLINLMKNAVEASSEDTPVSIHWQQFRQGIRLQVIDSGVGLPSSDNLFVPFYTTKAQGNGIGLFLCRQIAEGHNGTLRLINRTDHSGCIAECWLPTRALND